MKSEPDQIEIDSLIATLVGDPTNVAAAERLLLLLQRGANPARLRPLLFVDDVEAVEIAVWIASEVGIQAKAILEDIVEQLKWNNSIVSFYVLDCLTSCASVENPDLILEGLKLINSSDINLVWKAQMFVLSLSQEILDAAKLALVSSGMGQSHILGLSLFQLGSRDVEKALNSDNQLERRYASIAAVKLSQTVSSSLSRALESDDEYVREFAKSAIKLGMAFTSH
jgi:hypothetical protein